MHEGSGKVDFVFGVREVLFRLDMLSNFYLDLLWKSQFPEFYSGLDEMYGGISLIQRLFRSENITSGFSILFTDRLENPARNCCDSRRFRLSTCGNERVNF